jgi:hypothetical protein
MAAPTHPSSNAIRQNGPFLGLEISLFKAHDAERNRSRAKIDAVSCRVLRDDNHRSPAPNAIRRELPSLPRFPRDPENGKSKV